MYRPQPLIVAIQVLACLLVLRTVAVVVLTYPQYLPPDFRSDFLLGRDGYFFGPYRWAFYVHVTSGPLCLALGLPLLSSRLRQRYPIWHRWLGRMTAGTALFLVAPSGLWMAFYAATGVVAGAGFAALAIATALCAVNGWRSAVRRRFDRHRAWMLRCYVLLASAVVLRAMGGLSEVLGVAGTYPYAAWLSWLVPLAAVEWFIRRRQ